MQGIDRGLQIPCDEDVGAVACPCPFIYRRAQGIAPTRQRTRKEKDRKEKINKTGIILKNKNIPILKNRCKKRQAFSFTVFFYRLCFVYVYI